MKRFRLYSLATFAVFAIILSGCDNVKKMKEFADQVETKLSPNPLEVHADKVSGTIEGTFPAKYFNKKATLEITPVLMYEGGELALPVKVLQGESVTENNQVIPFEAGGKFAHNFTFDYTDAMMKSELELRFVIIHKDKKIPIDLPRKVGIGIISTYKLVELNPKPIMLKENNYIKVISSKEEAQFNFVVNRSDIRKTELTRDDIKTLENFIVNTKKEEKLKLKDIKVSAYASPEGRLAVNEKLSVDRGKNAEKWLADLFKKSKIDGKPADFVSINTTSEDWEGFQKLVKESNIQDKELVLRVLSMYSDPEVREKEIRNMSKVFIVLQEKILPELRRSRMVANVDKVGYSDQEFLKMVQENKMDNLKVEELFYAASICTDDNSKIKVYNKAAELYNDVRAHNNIAYYNILSNNIAEAKVALTKAAAVDANNAAVKNNQGCVAMLEGNIEEALRLFTSGANAGPDAKYNLGIISILKSQYFAAVEYLAGSDSFNQGLAMLLTNKNDAAKNTFQKVNSAKASYGLAIVGARTNDETMVVTNLRNAFSKDASLKARAKKDVEFRNYFQNDAFNAIVQ
jgi:tetratricopeptide (TPR) repeat protein